MSQPRTAECLVRDVGRRIAELRRACGWTQETLAIGMGCSVKYVQSVEAGTQNLTLKSLSRIAQKLGVDSTELLQRPRPSRDRR